MLNPIIFIDPDGNTVYIYNSQGEHIATFSKDGDFIKPGHETDEFLVAYQASKAYLENGSGRKVLSSMEDREERTHLIPLGVDRESALVKDSKVLEDALNSDGGPSSLPCEYPKQLAK